MMSSHAPSTPSVPPPWIDAPLSLEERLRVVRERCRLLADMFSIQAEATFLACHVSLSADAFNALTDICRSSADDLERLAQDIPGAIANWCPGVAVEGSSAYAASGQFGGDAPGDGLVVGLEGQGWDRCKNPVDGDERP
jgi:hypothetical protein